MSSIGCSETARKHSVPYVDLILLSPGGGSAEGGEGVLAARTGSGPMRMCGDIFAAARRWKSTISNAGRVSPLVLSSIPAVPFDSTIRMVWVRSPSFAAISRGILYGCPVLYLRGSVNTSAV